MNAEQQFPWFDSSVNLEEKATLAKDLAFSQLDEFAKSLAKAQADYMDASNNARKMGIISEQEYDAICKKIYSNKYTKSYWDHFQFKN